MAKNNLIKRLVLMAGVGTAVLGGCATIRENRMIDEALKGYEAKKVFAESSWNEGVVDTGEGYEVVASVPNYSERRISIIKAEAEARERLTAYIMDSDGDGVSEISPMEITFKGLKTLERMFGSDGVTVRMAVPYSGVEIK